MHIDLFGGINMFHSTRGDKLVSSPEAILNGIAEDGGLYVIDKLPNINYHNFLNLFIGAIFSISPPLTQVR